MPASSPAIVAETFQSSELPAVASLLGSSPWAALIVHPSSSSLQVVPFDLRPGRSQMLALLEAFPGSSVRLVQGGDGSRALRQAALLRRADGSLRFKGS